MEQKRYDNHLGIRGWVTGGAWGWERYLYSLHRLTGLGILLFFVIHIFASTARIYGPETWNAAMQTLKTPLFRLGEFALFVAFVFHALNGIRLILVELGFAVGKAEEPVFPYTSSIHHQRPLLKVVMGIAGVLIVLGVINTLFLGH